MKRTKALSPLSHQHHQGLFVAAKLKRAEPTTAVEARRAYTEHVDLRRRGADLETGSEPDPAEPRELGERLESHIRHQERVLFLKIEAALPAEKLERLAAVFLRAAGDV